MNLARPILIYEQDAAVLASLQFALTLEGYFVANGADGQAEPNGAACLIIEQCFGPADGLALLARLRAEGCRAPAILLSTNPTRSIRERAAAAGVVLVEKPLLSDALLGALRGLVRQDRAA